MTGPLLATPVDPVANGERIDLIDALRGFALAGVLMMNLGEFTLVRYLDNTQRAALPTAGFDHLAEMGLRLLVDGKAFTVFSLLFGVGFAMQLERARDASGLWLYLRRIAVLFVFGCLHRYLLWWGDVLLVYALLALLLIPFRHMSDRSVLAAGLLISLCLLPLLKPAVDLLSAGQPSDPQMHARNLAAFLSRSYVDASTQNHAFAQWAWLGMWGLLPFAFGRFLLGYWTGRRGLLRQPAAHRALLLRLCSAGVAIGLTATCVTLAQGALRLEARAPALASGVGQFGLRVIQAMGPLALGIAYSSGFALLFLRPAWRPRLQLLAPVGRMALTNYLMQSLVCVPLFYGFGLGLGPRYGYLGMLLVWALLFAFQIAFSHWWLARFRFGPMEWAWRSATYARLQPMQLPAPAPAAIT